MSNLPFSIVYVTFLKNMSFFIFEATDRTQVQGARELDAEARFEPIGRK